MITTLSRTARIIRTVATAVCLSAVALGPTGALAGGGGPRTMTVAPNPSDARFEELNRRISTLQTQTATQTGSPITISRDNLSELLAQVGAIGDGETRVAVRLFQYTEEMVRRGALRSDMMGRYLVDMARQISVLEREYILRNSRPIPTDEQSVREIARQVGANEADLPYVMRSLQLSAAVAEWHLGTRSSEPII